MKKVICDLVLQDCCYYAAVKKDAIDEIVVIEITNDIQAAMKLMDH
jgi:hypothetical protein